MLTRTYTRTGPDGAVTEIAYEVDAAAAAEESRGDRLRQARATLNTWAEQARAVEAQAGNVTQAQLKALFGRFGTLCDRLADLLGDRV